MNNWLKKYGGYVFAAFCCGLGTLCFAATFFNPDIITKFVLASMSFVSMANCTVAAVHQYNKNKKPYILKDSELQFDNNNIKYEPTINSNNKQYSKNYISNTTIEMQNNNEDNLSL